MNNLLEHLHASFFFYLLVKPSTFLKIGSYLPSVILVSVSMMFTGLGEWTGARWYEDISKSKSTEKNEASKATKGITYAERPRPVLQALLIVLATHLAGIALFYVRTSGFAGVHPEVRISFIFSKKVWILSPLTPRLIDNFLNVIWIGGHTAFACADNSPFIT